MVQHSFAPTTAAVVALSGGHPGNPWREQRLLLLYQATSASLSEPTRDATLVPVAAAA